MKKQMKHQKRSLFMFWTVLLAAAFLFPLAGHAEAKTEPVSAYEMLAQPGIRIAVGLNAPVESILKQEYPNAELIPYTDIFLAYTDVAKGRVDVCLSARKEMELALQNGLNGVHLLDEDYITSKVAVGISPVTKIPDLKEKLNSFIAELKADGTLDDMYERWVEKGDETMPDIPQVENAAFTLNVGTTGTVMPYSYYIGSELAGYDIELAYRFASYLGAELRFKPYDFHGIFAAAESGAIDCIMSNLFYTEEKSETIPFSDVLFEVGITAMVPGEGQSQEAEEKSTAKRWQDYNGKRLGILTGPVMENAAAEYFPDSEIVLLNSYPDCIAALLAGKIDAYLADEPGAKSIHAEQPKIDYIHDRITQNNYSFAFRKGDRKSAKLCAELNDFLARKNEDGTIQELDEIWFGNDEERKVVDMSDLTGENGTIRVVTTSTDMPFSYIKDGKNVGYDIDLVVRFCRDRGYALELGDVDFSARIPALQSGKYDFTTDMNVTPEREEQVLFSDPTSYGGIVLTFLADESPEADCDGSYSSLSQMDGKRIGVSAGSIFDKMVANILPNAKIGYFSSQTDLLAALSAGKIDAFVSDEPVIRYLMSQREDLSYIPEYLESFDFAFCFPKTEKGKGLCDEFNGFLRGMKADGSLEALEEKWFESDEEIKTMPDINALPSVNGSLIMATNPDYMPFEYIRNQKYVGYEMELAALFCEACGYGLKVLPINMDGLLASVQTGKSDFVASGISITPEREESMYFSESIYSGGTVLAVLKADGTELSGGRNPFLSRIASSFNKTFIRENRWKLFLEGIDNTLQITVLSILFGTILGFLVFMTCRNGNPVANGITRFSTYLVQGMPMVVLLMILYYVIFGNVSISGIAVAVIGFTLTFGSSVCSMLRMGVSTIDRGQYEAAYALGHTNRHTFFRIILPQAIPIVLPAYQGEVTGLLKATSIVGYIAVQDLTKMGDIVRSRTYEAFFPLIAITIIYFLLEGIFSLALSFVRKAINPRKRSREQILKGVNVHD